MSISFNENTEKYHGNVYYLSIMRDDNNNASVDKKSVGPAKLVVNHKGQQLIAHRLAKPCRKPHKTSLPSHKSLTV